MEEMMFYNKHYITVDEQNRIIDGFSDAFHEPKDTDICINEQGGYQFRLFPGGEENPPLVNMYGVPLYAWDGSVVIPRSSASIAADTSQAMLPTESEVRSTRDRLLAETDWTQVLDAPIDTETREAYRVYRQALRDVPEQEDFPTVVVWPELPAVGKAAPDPVDTAVDAMLEV